MRTSNPESRSCRACGKPVPNDAPFGHCPACLVELGFGPLPADAVLASSPGGTRRLGEYELLEQIGRGGMGVVYKARQVSLKRLVALKMLGPHASAFPGIADRLRLEAELAGGLSHPQIVTIYDVGEYEGQPFFTMKLIEGTGLDKLIGPEGFRLQRTATDPPAKRNGAEAQAARVMVQIARAVDYAHKHGVLHRDLKPANILIDAKSEPHLTDFGLAKALGRIATTGTASGAIMGTPAYMAPEQAVGATKHTSTAADIYSLGAILYEMLTGHQPFRAETPLETLRRVVEEVPKPPSTFNRNLDADLAIICLKCLEKVPQHRYGSAEAFADDLERWLRGEPIEARSVHRLERFWRWCRRQPVLAGLTIGVALLLVATTAFALIAYRESKRGLEAEQTQGRKDATKLLDRITRDWEDDDRHYVHLSAEELGILSDNRIAVDVNETVIKLGLQLPGKDRSDPQMRIMKGLPALAAYLRTNISPRSVRCDVFIYKSSPDAVVGLLKGEVDLMQLNSAAYVEARRREIPLVPIVAQTYDGKGEMHGAIFVHKNSGINQLGELKGRNFAFADLDSAIGHYLAKVALLDAGLRLRDLSGLTNTRPWHTTRLVREGKFAAGAAEFWYVDELIKAGAPLKILREVRSPSVPWVATTNLAPDLRAAIQRSLVSLTDGTILAGISRGLTGFQAITAADYDELEQQMARASLFDESPEPPR